MKRGEEGGPEEAENLEASTARASITTRRVDDDATDSSWCRGSGMMSGRSNEGVDVDEKVNSDEPKRPSTIDG